jgi:lysophospholipase L1-like esterase
MSLRPLLSRLALVLAASGLILVAAEMISRAAEPGPFSLWDRNPYRPDERLHHRHRPGFEGRFDGSWYAINSLGFRGPELPVAPEAGPAPRVLVALGDSCTFGKGVLESESWPRQLEALVGQMESIRPVIVANLGINGYSSRDYLIWFKEAGVPLRPEIVVLGFNINDFPNAIAAADRAVQKREGVRGLMPQSWWHALGRTALFRLARGLFYEWTEERDWARAEAFARGTEEGAFPDEAWAKVEGHLAELKRLVRGSGGELGIFLFPYESQVVLEGYQRAPVERLARTCGELDVPFVDLVTEFRNRLRAGEAPDGVFQWGDHYHPNAIGQRFVAEAVMEMIQDQGWLREDR